MRASPITLLLFVLFLHRISCAQNNNNNNEDGNFHNYQYEKIHDDPLPPASTWRDQNNDHDEINDTTDVEEGAVDIYDKFNTVLGGDSVKWKEPGIRYNGWFEEYYENGLLKHKGYYENGKLSAYKNYYDNGWKERIFKTRKTSVCQMKKYYRNAVLKQKQDFYNGRLLTETDYYNNGKIEYYEENDKSFKYAISWKYFYENGEPRSINEISDKTTLTYTSKEYWDNGNIKEKGNIIYNKDLKKYQKDGKWCLYTTSGKKIGEESYEIGQLIKEIKYP